MPWDVAINLDPAERVAYIVILGRLETGDTFDWTSMSWRER